MDQCKHCTYRGDYDACKKAVCGHHENWINQELQRRYEELHEVALAMRDWIDSVPKDLPLPTMPGFDPDWADSVLDSTKS